MGTKNTPGAYDCYANAEPDEPMFVLLARDPLAPMLVDLWGDLRARMEGDPGASVPEKVHHKIVEARACVRAMREWRDKNVTTMESIGKANLAHFAWAELIRKPAEYMAEAKSVLRRLNALMAGAFG